MVSLVAQPATPLAILLQCQALNMCPAAELFAWPHRGVLCLWAALPQKMICWIPWGAVLGAFWVLLLPDGLDLLPGVGLWVGVLMCTKDLANAGESVLSLRVFLPLFTI